jgi:hypothetical protein
MTIHYLPLEPEEMRYTAHLDQVIRDYLDKNHSSYTCYSPVLPQDLMESKLPDGCFLNAPKTIAWKAMQIAQLANAYACGHVKDGDTVFISDMWAPGIEAIRYLDFFTKKKVRLIGWLYAGTFTDTDFVRQFERWGSMQENVWFDIFDKIIVLSEFQKRDVLQKRLIDEKKILVSRLPIDTKSIQIGEASERDDVVVFNGRICDEKQPWLFNKLEEAVTKRIRERGVKTKNLSFINTQKLKLDKSQYYALLSYSKVCVSFALQENYGIALIEATLSGCFPIVPNRLVYPELYPQTCLYKDFESCVEQVFYDLTNYNPISQAGIRMHLKKQIDFSIAEWFK